MKKITLSTYTIICLFLFFTNILSAQINLSENTGYTPRNSFETVFDAKGNEFFLENIAIKPKTSVLNNKIINSTLLGNSGYFDLYFEDGSGFESASNPNQIARRNIICKVFEDLSNFINSPLSTNGEKVKIWIRNFKEIPNTNANILGTSSGYYNVPSNNNLGGIVHNEIWKTMQSGTDSYQNIIVRDREETNIVQQFYHGYLAIKTTGVNWHTTLNQNPPNNQYDLYTEVLKQATHALGLVSLINRNGVSKFGTTKPYFSTYDTFLKTAGNISLINTTNTVSVNYNNAFLAPTTSLNGNCVSNNLDFTNCSNAIQFVGANIVKVFTPNCFNIDQSLSCFEDQCAPINNNNNYFVTSNTIAKGISKRYLKPEERLALNDIGYSVKATFGSTASLNNFTYNTPETTGSRIVGLNDGLTASGYKYIGTTNKSIKLKGFLGNDLNFENNILNPANIRFEGLQDIFHTTDGTTTLSATNGDANTTVNINSSVSGLHILRYVPYNIVTGKRGNTTYIFLFFIENCAKIPVCDLVYNGDFEDYDFDPLNQIQIAEACNWYCYGYGLQAFSNTTLNAVNNTSLVVNGVPRYGQPTNAFGTQLSYNGVGNGYNFAQSVGLKRSGILSQLTAPLLPNTTYTVKLNVSLAEGSPLIANNGAKIQVYLGYSPSLSIGPDFNLLPEFEGILLNNPTYNNNTTGWDNVSITFTTSDTAGQEWIWIGGINNVQEQIPLARRVFYIDNVSLKPVYNATLNLPDTLCSNLNISNLETYVTNPIVGGIFSGPGVLENNGIYAFDATIAGIGTHTITYADATGCFTTTDTIIVNSCLPALPPYISQTYAFDGTNQFIEIKNKDNTTAIAPGMYYLALYENGAPTNLAPTSFIDLGNIPTLSSTVFKNSTATAPNYAVTSGMTWTGLNTFNADNDIIILTTTNDSTAYNNRIDLVGDASNWGNQNSLVRIACAPQAPRIDAYNEQDWVAFTKTEVVSATSKTNAVLGRHYDEILKFENTNTWNEENIPNILPAVNESNPDRSRAIQLSSDYSTAIYGDFEACSLIVGSNVILTITATRYVKVQISVNVLFDGQLIIENAGSLVMARDSYYGVSGTNLVNLGANSTLQVTKNTVNLDSPYDYVYWSSPLSSKPSNPTAGQIFSFGSGVGQFNPSRFYRFENQNLCDILNIYNTSNGSVDGLDDNFDDYVPFTILTAAPNQQLIPGRGYAAWPPVPVTAGNFNYSVTFTGEMNNGLVTVPVYKNNSVAGLNSNLVGNPYPSAINLDLFFAKNTNLIRPYAAIWTRVDDVLSPINFGPNALNYTAANFAVYTTDMTINPTNLFINNTLSSGQSFFVRVYKDFTGFTPINPIIATTPSIAPGEQIAIAGDLIFSNSMRTTAPNNTFSRSSNAIAEDKIWLNLTDSQNYTAQLGIYFKPTGNSAYVENEDVSNIYGRKYNFYTQTGAEDLLIDIQNGFETSKIIPLGITNTTAANQNFTISIPKKGGVFNSQTVYLQDTLLGAVHNLSNAAYAFTTQEAITENRFKLLFDNNLATFTNKTKKQENEVLVTLGQNSLTISSSSKKIASVQVFDIYTINASANLISKTNNLYTNELIVPLDTKAKLLSLKIVMEDGTIINKKIAK